MADKFDVKEYNLCRRRGHIPEPGGLMIGEQAVMICANCGVRYYRQLTETLIELPVKGKDKTAEELLNKWLQGKDAEDVLPPISDEAIVVDTELDEQEQEVTSTEPPPPSPAPVEDSPEEPTPVPEEPVEMPTEPAPEPPAEEAPAEPEQQRAAPRKSKGKKS